MENHPATILQSHGDLLMLTDLSRLIQSSLKTLPHMSTTSGEVLLFEEVDLIFQTGRDSSSKKISKTF